MSRSVFGVLVLAGLLGPTLSQAAQVPLNMRTYQVPDLVVGPMVGGMTPEGALVADLMRIQAASWERNGGRGTMQFHPLTCTLVVNQTDAVHQLIELHLEALRGGGPPIQTGYQKPTR